MGLKGPADRASSFGGSETTRPFSKQFVESRLYESFEMHGSE
jgi:hypothetical protein